MAIMMMIIIPLVVFVSIVEMLVSVDQFVPALMPVMIRATRVTATRQQHSGMLRTSQPSAPDLPVMVHPLVGRLLALEMRPHHCSRHCSSVSTRSNNGTKARTMAWLVP